MLVGRRRAHHVVVVHPILWLPVPIRTATPLQTPDDGLPARLPWYSNILLDIPTHTLQFFPTPVFYPLSDFGVDGTRWSDPVILVPNVVLLAGLWFYVKRKDRQERQAENQPLV